MPKKFDVFLSHHSSDKPWVIKLKGALESRGYSVWLDKDEIRPGDLFAKSIEDGLQSSQNIVFVVTSNSMKSKWVEEEYYRALTLSKSKKQPARLIPIIYQMTAIPGFLSSRNWVDFRNEMEFPKNLEKLIWGITGEKETSTEAVEIPFVIVAMTLPQARELFEKKTQKNSTIGQFKKNLFGHVEFDYSKVYGENPDNWKFSPNPEEEITSVVWKTLLAVNEKRQSTLGNPVFKPKFESVNFFSGDFDKYTQTWGYLKNSGCVLIVDAVSLFHPDIIKRLNDFHVEPNDNVAMVVISPLDTYSHPLTKMVEDELRNHLQMAYIKYDTNLDIQCNFEIGNLRSFKRWALSALPELAEVIRNKKLNLSNRDYIREKMGVPAGIDKLIFGTGSGK